LLIKDRNTGVNVTGAGFVATSLMAAKSAPNLSPFLWRQWPIALQIGVFVLAVCGVVSHHDPT
jgi:hypothetical protein